MNILLVHEVFYPNFVGGGEVIILNLIRQLIKRGHKVLLLTSGKSIAKKYEGIPVKYITQNRFLMNFTFLKIAKIAKRFDLIQCTTYNAAFPSYVASLISKKPIMLLVLGSYEKRWLKIRGKFLGLVFMLVERFFLLLPYDHIITLSSFSKDTLIQMGVNKNIISISNPGIEWKKYSKPVNRKKTQVLFVGRIDEQKGIKYLLDAASHNPSVNFIVAGTGRLDSFLKAKASKNMKILGFLEREKLKKIYSESSIFCLPSEGETFGLAILEAMHNGCAIVSTVPLDYKGIHLTKPEDLTVSIKKLFDNPYKVLKAGKENAIISRKYTWENFSKIIEQKYLSIIN